MSLLIALLRDGDYDSAEKLITTDPSSVWTNVDDDEEPSIFYSFKSVTTLERILLVNPEYAWVTNSRGE